MDEMESLKAELDHYKAEKEKIRDIVGQIGGHTNRQRHFAVNMVFLIVVVAAFTIDLLRSLLQFEIPYLPPLLLLEIAVLLVSLKIIWMIHTKSKVDHFQFWILHSIEFQMNILSRRLADLSEQVQSMESKAGEQGVQEPAGSDRS